MKRTAKTLLNVLLITIIVLAVYVSAYAFIVIGDNADITQEESEMQKLALGSERVDYNEDNGILYINNEIVVFMRNTATDVDIEEFLADCGAEADESMADIGVYKLIYRSAMSYGELEELVSDLNRNAVVDRAYINALVEFEEDTADDDFDYAEPVYPNDDWNADKWDVNAARGENWGMEAIDAPGAWGYLDRMSTVKVGLIDSKPDSSHKEINIAASTELFIDVDTSSVSTNKYNISADDHGTHVSGIMNAAFNNKSGVSGTMGTKGELYYSAVYYDDNGKVSSRFATAYDYLLALKTLIDQNVQVINISQNTSRLIGFAASHGNENAINYLELQATVAEKGLLRIINSRQVSGKPDFVICVAAGNSNNTYYYKDEHQIYGYRESMTFWEAVKSAFGFRGERGGSQARYNNFLNLMSDETVEGRVVVVGAVQIDTSKSSESETRYKYTSFSNVGERVDIVAPGYDVYSTIVGGYRLMSGTSMAAPHVSGVAGLVFACNPSLSGEQVKKILVSSAVGRYNYEGGYSGLVNANNAVVMALKTLEKPVEKVINPPVNNGLDLCFVVDTTGSMGDDIDNAKENMAEILAHLKEKTENYRVALVDYRDFARSSYSVDYPYDIKLHFTQDNEAILSKINGLTLGSGGDTPETVYSALMAAIKMLSWREDAKKVIIILGDAPPHDPEPNTGYTYDHVLAALYHADINIDYDNSDDRVMGEAEDSAINVFSISSDADTGAVEFFEKLAHGTGGSHADVADSSMVGDAIVESIEQIEITETVSVRVDFSDAMAGETIDFFLDDEYKFTLVADENGVVDFENVECGKYSWESGGIYTRGTFTLESNTDDVSVRKTEAYWFAPLLEFFEEYKLTIVFVAIATVIVCALIPYMLYLIVKAVLKTKKVLAGMREMSAKKAEVKAKQKEIREAAKQAKKSEELISNKPDGFCTHCGSPIKAGVKFCTGCGSPMKAEVPEKTKIKCQSCGLECDNTLKFCTNCGNSLVHDNAGEN